MCGVCLCTSNDENLVSIKCYFPSLHAGITQRKYVTWDPKNGKLVSIHPRPLVGRFIKGFQLCDRKKCQRSQCTYAHSEIERVAWNYDLTKEREGIINLL